MTARKKPRREADMIGTTTAEEAGDYLLFHKIDLDGYSLHLIGPDGEDRGRVTGLLLRPEQTILDALRDATPSGEAHMMLDTIITSPA